MTDLADVSEIVRCSGAATCPLEPAPRPGPVLRMRDSGLAVVTGHASRTFSDDAGDCRTGGGGATS